MRGPVNGFERYFRVTKTKQNQTTMESLILAQDERWRRA